MFFFRAISRLPFGVLYLLSDFLYLIAYKLLRYRVKVVDQNLKKCFPHLAPQTLLQIRKDYYKNLCDIIVESIKLLTISEKEFLKRVNITNIDLPIGYQLKGSSILVVCGHTGNWEWLLQACAIRSVYPIYAVYKPLSSPFFDKLMLQVRSRFGPIPLDMKDVPRDLVKNRKNLRAIAMVADQTPPKSDEQFSNLFLNRQTPWFVGAEKIANMTKMPVIYVGMSKLGRGRYEVRFETISEPPYDPGEDFPIIEAFSRKLEQNIKAQPACWLWSHRRWKHVE